MLATFILLLISCTEDNELVIQDESLNGIITKTVSQKEFNALLEKYKTETSNKGSSYSLATDCGVEIKEVPVIWIGAADIGEKDYELVRERTRIAFKSLGLIDIISTHNSNNEIWFIDPSQAEGGINYYAEDNCSGGTISTIIINDETVVEDPLDDF